MSASPTALLRQPSALDLATKITHSDGRVEIIYLDERDIADAAAQRDAYQRQQVAEMAAQEHVEAIAARVREAIEAGPPGDGEGSPLERHLAWIRQAQRKVEAAQARVEAAQSAADRHEAAKDAYAIVTAEVYEAAQAWVRYATSRDPDDDDLRPMPDTRQAVLADLETEIAATRMLHDVLPLARFEVEVAAGVLAGLELMEPYKRAEDVISAELPRLTTLLEDAVADITKVYGYIASLDELARPSWETAAGMRTLGVEPPARLVYPGTTALPSVAGRKLSIDVEADPDALVRYRAASAAPGNAVALIAPPSPPPPEPASRIARAIKLFTGE